jgi:outer membrane receptor protein involved in Fe transport
MRGAEFQVVHDAIPGLPGPLEKRLGISLNFTKFWGEMEYLSGTTFVPLNSLQYQPAWLANATVYYKLPRKGEIRVSYHRQGRAPISLGAYPWTTYWLNPKGQLDMALRYSITDRIIAKLQIGNVTNEGVSQAYITPYPMNRYEMTRNRTLTLDMIYKF